MAKQPSNFGNSSGSNYPAVAGGSGAGIAAPGAPSARVEVKPTLDAIRKRAYEIYLARATKGQSGTPESDWQQAERELKSRR